MKEGNKHLTVCYPSPPTLRQQVQRLFDTSIGISNPHTAWAAIGLRQQRAAVVRNAPGAPTPILRFLEHHLITTITLTSMGSHSVSEE